MRLADCHNFHDFQRLAERRLPGRIFNCIDGGADDEVTLRRNTEAFEFVGLVTNVLRGVTDADLSTEIMGQKLDLPVYLSPTALQRLFHHEGERATAAAKFGTMFGVSSLGTVSMAELAAKHDTPQVYQFYFHKDRGLNSAMMLAPPMNWDDVDRMVAEWGGPFCLKGVMSIEDTKKAAEIGCRGIVLSNHRRAAAGWITIGL